MLDAVIAVITKGEKVLLIQRAPGIRGGGYWAPVSGEVEPGESQEAAVAREAIEEVGLTVRPIRKVWENFSTRGTFRLHWWIAEFIGGELALNAAEVSDARWLTVDGICRLNGTFEGDREFYRKILPSLASESDFPFFCLPVRSDKALPSPPRLRIRSPVLAREVLEPLAEPLNRGKHDTSCRHDYPKRGRDIFWFQLDASGPIC